MNYTEFVNEVFNNIEKTIEENNRKFNDHYNAVLYPWFSEGKVISISWEEDDDDYRDDWECGLVDYLIKDNKNDTYEIKVNASHKPGVFSLGNFDDVAQAASAILNDYNDI